MITPQTRAYRKGELVAEGFPVAAVSDHLADPDVIVWVDLCGPTLEQLHELADELGLHELAVEDALGPHQRPKLDHYSTHLFFSCHAVSVDRSTGVLVASEIDSFINDRWLITVRKEDDFSIEPVVRRWDRSADLAVAGVPYLLYGLLDVVTDGYFQTVSAFDEYYDDVAGGIFSDQPLQPQEQKLWFQMRQSLIRFHRLALPLREAVSGLMRHEQMVVSQEIYPYYQDAYDHILRVSESTDSLRDLVSTIVETNLSLRDFRQNQIMKKVTSWAAIIAVPTLITGYYGMNVPYPGALQHWGVWVSTGLIVVLSLTLYLQFKKRDWL